MIGYAVLAVPGTDDGLTLVTSSPTTVNIAPVVTDPPSGFVIVKVYVPGVAAPSVTELNGATSIASVPDVAGYVAGSVVTSDSSVVPFTVLVNVTDGSATDVPSKKNPEPVTVRAVKLALGLSAMLDTLSDVAVGAASTVIELAIGVVPASSVTVRLAIPGVAVAAVA